MIRHLVILLLLVSSFSSEEVEKCADLRTNENCGDCIKTKTIASPKDPNTKEKSPEEIHCPGKLWFIDGTYSEGKNLICTKVEVDIEGTKVTQSMHWETKIGGKMVTEAHCVEEKLCYLSSPLDVKSINRLIKPKVTNISATCPSERNASMYVVSEGMSSTGLSCNKESGKWQTARNKTLHDHSIVYCEGDLEKEEARADGERLKDEEYEGKEDDIDEFVLVNSFLIFLGIAIVFTLATLSAHWIHKFYTRKRVDKYANGVWTKHWEIDEAPNKWDWRVILLFLDSWKDHSVQERANFLEIGYSELGYKSSIVQMLYIFEFMLIVEKHHLVWRPMINFIIRLERLASLPFTDAEISEKFHSWIAYKGEQLIDHYGFYPFDVQNYCESDNEKEKKKGGKKTALGSGKEKKVEEGVKKEEGKKEESKEGENKGPKSGKGAEDKGPKSGKGGETRNAAGADDAPKEEASDAGGAAPAASPAAASGSPAPPAAKRPPLEKKVYEDKDPHNTFCRYMGAFLMHRGDGAQTKLMYGELDQLYSDNFLDVEGPLRAAIGVARVMRDLENNIEIERIWARVNACLPEDMVPEEWGSVWEHGFFILGHVTDEEIAEQVATFVLTDDRVTSRQIGWWIKGGIERGAPFHLSFLIKQHAALAKKLPMDGDIFYKLLRLLCLFDHTDEIWDKIERLVVLNDVLAKKLNVPSYRRRANHFNWYFRNMGSFELQCFLTHPKRMAVIDEVDFEYVKKAAAGRPAN